jgi:hypothetical protein
VKDLQGLPKEIQTRIASLATKTTPQQRQETTPEVLGTGWETALTVKVELSNERLNKLLAGVGTEDTPSQSESILRIRGGGNWCQKSGEGLETSPVTEPVYALNYQCRYAIVWLV